jgi:competence protein ComEC
MKTFKYYLILVLALLVVLSVSCQFLPSTILQTSAPAGLRVTFLDVGQADSILIQVDGSTMLIDAGTNSTADKLVNMLKSKGINKFDVIAGTHPHEDHIGGMDAVINSFNIEKIYMPQVSTTTKTFDDVLQAIKNHGLVITSPEPGTSFSLNSAICTILAPNSPQYEDLNDYSIVIQLLYGNTSFLFTGDAQADSEKEILAKGYTLQSDVLKVGHHGSSSSTSPEFLKAVSPRYAIISVGKDNDYGHPHRETLDKLNASGINIFRTDLNGSITFNSDGGKLTIKTEK